MLLTAIGIFSSDFLHETYHFFYINLSIFYAQARLESPGGSAEQM